ncbi:MAG: DUF501 domain-containing protein, partial [Bifidobacteriaceae bacterium]|jgi:hypothetical protein|nr:DUF501 domain-containing protein [Bifidobacteriaceae bacterium]
LNERLSRDPVLAQAYRHAHCDYLGRRAQLGAPPEIAGISAGGMPDRVKCLHALVAHSLACGPGINPVGDLTLAALAPHWRPDRCACAAPNPPHQAPPGPADSLGTSEPSAGAGAPPGPADLLGTSEPSAGAGAPPGPADSLGPSEPSAGAGAPSAPGGEAG